MFNVFFGKPKPRPDPTVAASRMVTRFRFVAWVFLMLGSIVAADPVRILFDPRATIPVNGVPTSDFTTKLLVAGFVLIYPLIGAFLIFTPRRILVRWLIAFIHWAQAHVRRSHLWPGA